MMDVNFKQLMDKQDLEFYQLALLLIIQANGGSIAFDKTALQSVRGIVGQVEEINGKVVIKAVPKPVNFDEKAAEEFFAAARENADAVVRQAEVTATTMP